MKEQDLKWLATTQIRQEAILIGEIKSIVEEKQRFYYHRYIVVITIKLQTATKLITTKKIIPITKHMKKDSFTIGEVIRLYGKWEGSNFLFSYYEDEIPVKVTKKGDN
jgi:hypothetical protein